MIIYNKKYIYILTTFQVKYQIRCRNYFEIERKS